MSKKLIDAVKEQMLDDNNLLQEFFFELESAMSEISESEIIQKVDAISSMIKEQCSIKYDVDEIKPRIIHKYRLTNLIASRFPGLAQKWQDEVNAYLRQSAFIHSISLPILIEKDLADLSELDIIVLAIKCLANPLFFEVLVQILNEEMLLKVFKKIENIIHQNDEFDQAYFLEQFVECNLRSICECRAELISKIIEEDPALLILIMQLVEFKKVDSQVIIDNLGEKKFKDALMSVLGKMPEIIEPMKMAHGLPVSPEGFRHIALDEVGAALFNFDCFQGLAIYCKKQIELGTAQCRAFSCLEKKWLSKWAELDFDKWFFSASDDEVLEELKESYEFYENKPINLVLYLLDKIRAHRPNIFEKAQMIVGMYC